MKRRILPVVLGAAVLAFTTAAAAMAQQKGSGALGGKAEITFVIEIALLLLVGRGLGEVMQRLGQPAVIGQLLAGLLLGPSLFGWVWPHAHHLIFPDTSEQKSMLAGISNVGVMMLLLLTGMETDLKLVRQVGTPALTVTVAGVAVPFLCGFTLGEALPEAMLPNPQHRLVAALFLGTALSISSIKIVAMVVREMNFMRRNLGQIIVASAIMEDTIGWVIISITLGIAGAGGVAVGSLAKAIVGTLLFLAFSYSIGRRLVFWLIRWVNDTFVSEYAVVTAILIVMCVMAMITEGIGVNTVLGAFVAGVLVGESPILSQHIEDQLRGFITAFMMPVFFGLSGLSADLTILRNPGLAVLTVGLVAIASVGKFGGAFVGGLISRLSISEAVALGSAMNARGSTEVIVATIGLTLGALTQDLYTMIVTMAVLTTMVMPPMLRWALRRLPMSVEERQRLEREAIDAKGFVSGFERLLIAADESANGKFASRLAGFVAGQRGMPITVLQLDDGRRAAKETEQSADLALKDAATAGAKEGHRAAQIEKGEGRPGNVEVLTRSNVPASDAVAKEADKGYDLLFVGVEKMRNADGTFSVNVDRAAADFEGPLALVVAGTNAGILEARGFNILIPVAGTEVSRRGAELAFALAPATASRATALHVAQRTYRRGGRESASRRRARQAAERAVLEDVARLARRYGYGAIKTAVHLEIAPDAAILQEAERSGADLIVIGASRRVGRSLYLGQTVTSVLQHWRGGVVLLVA